MKIKIALISCYLIVTSYSQIVVKEEIIDDGILYKKNTNIKDTLSIDLLKIDLSNNKYELRTVKANNLLNSRETTSEMVKSLSDSGYSIIAAINADFFEEDGEVVNNMISEGNIVKALMFTDSPFNPFVNSQFAVNRFNKLFIEQFVFNGKLILPNGIIESLNRVNSLPDSNSVILYNSFQGKYTPIAKEGWYIGEIPLVQINHSTDTIICIVRDDFQIGGKTEIKNNFVLSANNKYARYLEKEISLGDTLKVILGFNPDFKDINSLIGGWPRLVKDGQNLINNDSTIEGVIYRFSDIKHPRTGIGFSQDSSTVYFITVDGRQESSSGMTLKQFADLMIEEGIYQGLNLDGGGSTTMIVKGNTVNNPSDKTGERKVGNCIVLIKKQ